MQITVETITPKTAKEYLKANLKNRNLRSNHVENLARDMAAKNWQLNGDSIRFNCDGELLDGQHRLSAIVKSGTSIESVVVRGVEKGARMTIDAGAKRTAGDQFALMGVKYSVEVSAACRYAMSARLNPSMRPNAFTNSEIWDFYQKHQGISEGVGDLKARAPRGYSNIVAALVYCTQFENYGSRDEIMNAWLYGEGGRSHPCVVARERAIKDSLKSGIGGQLITQAKMRMVAHSMIKSVRGETSKVATIPELVWIPGWTQR